MNSVEQSYRHTIKAIRTKRRIYARGSRLLALYIAGLMTVIIVSVFAITPMINSQQTFNQFVPVNNQGQPILAIEGTKAHMPDEDIAKWVASCSEKALSFSKPSYRDDFMRFASSCLPSTKLSDWGQQLDDAGYLDLVMQGSILQFKTKNVELLWNRVLRGRRYWRFTVSGELVRYFNETYRTDIELTVTVARQDPFNYENAIAISQIVL